MSGNHDPDDATAPARPSRWAILHRPVPHNVVLLLLLSVLIVLVNAFAVQGASAEGEVSSMIAYAVVILLVPVIAVLVMRLVVPRPESRVEKFRPSPWDVENGKEAKPQAVGEAEKKCRETEAEPPAPFPKRLANYLHVPESEVLEPRPRWVSSMPFWCAVILPQRSTLAKSVEYIRAMLRRIRAAVRG
jgi:hypothetical protein